MNLEKLGLEELTLPEQKKKNGGFFPPNFPSWPIPPTFPINPLDGIICY